MEVLAYSFVSGSRLVTALRQKQPDAFPFQTRRTRAGTVYALVTDCGLNGKTTGPQSKKLRRVALGMFVSTGCGTRPFLINFLSSAKEPDASVFCLST
ncbi:hypothetical protein I7I50_03697 [Histoplasma capsulatum G186AR]|uniref:Uncharacterized protein n=1 Tax=Ajellomyces capsulatus TaxID=5037 RepID=A0A8H8CWN6_AJECA|nr:hypothetical protein I7I52_04604 [Histoplasma capsulatum]QSS74777.1 hypothetical protein I7I50_03697 [Histoplasma capsulatum G186AR]